MSTPEADQAPLLQPEDDVRCDNEREAEGLETTRSIEIGKVMENMKKSKSFDIMKSAMSIFRSNFKFILLMVLSIIPFFVFMVFYEIKLQKVAFAAPSVLTSPHRHPQLTLVSYSNGSHFVIDNPDKVANGNLMFLYDAIQVSLLYLTLYPLLEILSMVTTILLAAKVYAGEKLANLKEVFSRVNNLRGVVITCIYVQLLSFLSLLGLIWVVANHLIFFGQISFYDGFPQSGIVGCVYVIAVGLHTVFFMAVLYKYLYWSAYWNLSKVISVLEEEGGVAAFGMADYYGKHYKPTGFQLMLGFVVFGVALRLPCLYGGLCDWSGAGMTVTAGIIGFLCLGNLVKWVAFVLYFLDCKQQTLEKKNDDEIEIGKSGNAERSV